MAVYGYARVSRGKQDLERQLKAIREVYPDAPIVSEKFTARTLDRPIWQRLRKKLKSGDVVVFESVSRMSRDADEGFELYKELYDEGIELEFISQPFVNTSVYRAAAARQISLSIDTGNDTLDKCLQGIIDNINELIVELARHQIPDAFHAAEAELIEKSRATSQGVQLAKKRYDEEELNGLPHQKLRPGRQTGAQIETVKAKAAKEIIRKHCKDFGGSLPDQETMKLAGCSRNSYFKYKRQIREELANEAK